MSIDGSDSWPEPYEDLHPELRGYLGKDFAEEGGAILWESIKHPLVFSVPYNPALNATLNKCLQHKQEALRIAVKDSKYERAIWLHERPYRLLAFYRYQHAMTDKQYWKLLSDVWTDSEWPHVNTKLWRQLFNSKRGSKGYLMTRAERETLAGLPDPVLVYRGANNGFNTGIAWTLMLDKARWFACRFNQADPTILSMTVPKSEVAAYLDHRGEEEIILPNAHKLKHKWSATPCTTDPSPATCDTTSPSSASTTKPSSKDSKSSNAKCPTEPNGQSS